MSEIKVGDRVRITDLGREYTTYERWIDNYDIEDYDPGSMVVGQVGRVIEVGGHLTFKDTIVYAVADNKGNVILIGEKGIEKYTEEVELPKEDKLPKETSKPTVEKPNNYPQYIEDDVKLAEYLESKLFTDEFRGFLFGKTLECVAQLGDVEDLKKAEFYLTRLISTYESEE